MVPDDPPLPSTATRRAALGGAAGLLASLTGGCLQRTRSLIDRGSPEQVSLAVKTVPADADRPATSIGRMLVDNLTSVGIDAELVLESEDELRRSVLLNQDFDVYVAQYPEHPDPDFLRPLLHSVFVEEAGWQNPFGFVDFAVDEHLAGQRTNDGSDRRTAVHELLRTIMQLQPFVVVGFPDGIRAVRNDRFEGWQSAGVHSPLVFLSIRPRGNPGSTREHLRVTITDERVTENFNPIAVEFRNRGTFTGLLYDPLARHYAGDVSPWLAESWSWDRTESDGTTATVRLRDDLRWHDGRSLTAGDVAFTYEFMEDTSLAKNSVSTPAPRFRGPVSLVESVEAVDDRTLRFAFADTSPGVAVRAFTVPILPEREWRPKSASAEFAGLDLFDDVTEALIWENPEPVGSGVLAFERSIPEEALVLRRFDDHFLHRGDAPPQWSDGGVAFEELTVRVAPSDAAAVELVAIDEADATTASLDPTVVPHIGRNEDLDLVVTGSGTFYHVGFNARQEPLSNPRFRRAIARLVDKQHVADTVFEGYATPSAGPVDSREWTPSDLRWNGEDPSVPFVGSEGELDAATAREAFRGIGYQYDGEQRLLQR